MNTINFNDKWIERMAEKYISDFDEIIFGYMPKWLQRMTKSHSFGWKICERIWAWWVCLEIRMGSMLGFTEVYIKGKFVGSIKYKY